MRTTKLTLATLLITLGLVALAEAAHAGSWILKNSITITRGAAVKGRYPVQICFRVRRGLEVGGQAQVIMTNMQVLETDWLNQTISNGPVAIQIPAPGNTTAPQCFNFTYPCGWGSSIWFSVSSVRGFLGATGSASFFSFAPGEGSHAVSVGTLGLTPEVLGDPTLTSFFTLEDEEPLISVGRGFDGMDGRQRLGFNTTTLMDPASLGYELYAIELFGGGGPLLVVPIFSVDKAGDPEFMTDEEMEFGEPTDDMSIPDDVLDLDLVDGAIVWMVDIDDVMMPIPVFEGPIETPAAEVMVRFGTNGTLTGPPHDVLWINDDRGDEFRHMTTTAGAPLTISMLDFPGSDASVAYVLYAHLAENAAGDITPHPKGLGAGAFSTPLTGGAPVVLLNTIGKEDKIGSPKIGGTPFGPGTLLSLGSTPASLSGRTLTFQGIVADTLAPNSLASFSNAVVVHFD